MGERTPPKQLQDLTGKKFGRLTVKYPVFDGVRWRWHCICDCGNEKDVIPPDLKRGMVKSCGCYRRDFRRIDLTGKRFGNLTVLRKDDGLHKHAGQYWVCRCDCGREIVTRGDSLQTGHTKGCGCINHRRETHGKSGTKLFKVWTSMKQRCENPNDSAYKNYGGRGVSVCSEWHEFRTFYEWAIACGYREGLQIERIDNDGDYKPSNCKWATRLEQMSNRRNTVQIEIDGESHTIREWSEITGINRSTIDGRIRRGWSPKEALTPKE